jgi:hypothetical protein
MSWTSRRFFGKCRAGEVLAVSAIVAQLVTIVTLGTDAIGW